MLICVKYVTKMQYLQVSQNVCDALSGYEGRGFGGVVFLPSAPPTLKLGDGVSRVLKT